MATDLSLGVVQDGTNDSAPTAGWAEASAEVSAGGYTPNYRWNAIFRFTGVTIPNGSTINSAVIKLYGGANWGSAPYDTIIRGDNVDNSGVLSITHCLTSGWAATTAAPTWRIPAIVSDTQYSSASIAAIITEITSRVGWTSGNAICIAFDAANFPTSGTTNYMPFRSLEYSSGTYKPLLVINYTEPAGGIVVPVFNSQYRRRW